MHHLINSDQSEYLVFNNTIEIVIEHFSAFFCVFIINFSCSDNVNLLLILDLLDKSGATDFQNILLSITDFTSKISKQSFLF